MESDISLSFKEHNLFQVLRHQELDGKHLKSYSGILETGSTANDNSATSAHLLPSITNKLVLQSSSLLLRYDLKKKLKKHEGCVNTIQWSQDGEFLVTGSDDCRVCVWDSSYRLKAAVPTGHFRNIFSAKFVPGNNHQVVSTGMDGEVRLVHVEAPAQNPPVLLGSYDHMMYKVTFLPDSQAVFLSTHEDGCVRLFDIREKPGKEKLTLVKLRTGSKRPISANSLAFCPLGTMRFVLGGADPYIRLFDLRKVMDGSNLDSDQLCVLKMCPQSVLDSFGKAQDMYRYSITGVDYGINQVVATYSRENVYVFSIDGQATHKDVKTEYLKEYIGRRNVSTFLKEVQFVGNRQYIATGSDCGNLFIWHKDTADLVQLLKADENVVNGVAEHPYLPTLAVCGIDHTGKIFEPSEHVTFSPKRAATVTSSNEKRLHQQEEGMTLLQFLLANFGHAQEEEEEEEEPSEWDVKLADADELRLHANDRFREGNFEGAISLYDDALNVLNTIEEAPEEIQERKQQAVVLCMNNKAACHLKLQNNTQVVQICSEVLHLEPDNIKALYRRGTASMNLGDLEQAEKDLTTALQLCPEDAVIKKLLEDLAAKKAVKKDS